MLIRTIHRLMFFLMFIIIKVVGETQALMRNIIEEHKQSYDENNMRDFIDVYLRYFKFSW